MQDQDEDGGEGGEGRKQALGPNTDTGMWLKQGSSFPGIEISRQGGRGPSAGKPHSMIQVDYSPFKKDLIFTFMCVHASVDAVCVWMQW